MWFALILCVRSCFCISGSQIEQWHTRQCPYCRVLSISWKNFSSRFLMARTKCKSIRSVCCSFQILALLSLGYLPGMVPAVQMCLKALSRQTSSLRAKLKQGKIRKGKMYPPLGLSHPHQSPSLLARSLLLQELKSRIPISCSECWYPSWARGTASFLPS